VGIVLDTHIAIWVVLDDPRLSPEARARLQAQEGDLWVSTASLWEIAIKHGLKRGADPMPFGATEAMRLFEEAGLAFLPITPAHTAAVEQLPPLHSDPFDRMLVAQARHEPHHLMTADRAIAAYGGLVVNVR
jgi:PIN domain nuclease of toxin-antitoxin system